MSHFQNWKLKKFRPPLSRSRFFADSGYTKGSNAILANYNKSAEFISCNKTGLSRWTFDLAANSSLWRISLINYRDKDHRVNENDLPFNVGASASIDRSSLSRSASLTEQKKERERDDEQWRTRLERRGSWVERAGLCLTTDNSLIQCDRCKVGSMIATVRSRSFSARNARSDVLPRTTRRSTGHVYTLANTCSSQL